jgi:hypothetical protein
MKKYLLAYLFFLAAANLSAQQLILPTAEQIERFSRTTTHVVLTGENMLLDMSLREAVEKKWKITPVRFIDEAEFKESMTDANRTFLVMVGGTFKKDKELNNYIFLNLMMGGGVSLDQLTDFILIPITCEGQGEDKPIMLMEAFLDIIQRHVKQLQENPKKVGLDLDTYNANLDRLHDRQVLITEEDFAYPRTPEELNQQFGSSLELVSFQDLEKALQNGTRNKVAALTLYPRIGEPKGTYCYNMLVACDTHELIYFKRHKVRGTNQQGFLKEEIKRIARYTQKK